MSTAPCKEPACCHPGHSVLARGKRAQSSEELTAWQEPPSPPVSRPARWDSSRALRSSYGLPAADLGAQHRVEVWERTRRIRAAAPRRQHLDRLPAFALGQATAHTGPMARNSDPTRAGDRMRVPADEQRGATARIRRIRTDRGTQIRGRVMTFRAPRICCIVDARRRYTSIQPDTLR